MFSGDGLRPVGHPERCVQIRGERGSDEGGAKKLNVEAYDFNWAASITSLFPKTYFHKHCKYYSLCFSLT